MFELHLERVCIEENARRFYRIYIFKNLFDDWQLERSWGRIGTTGRTASYIVPNIRVAMQCVEVLRSNKVSRGYIETLREDNITVKLIQFIPKSSIGYMNANIVSLLGREKQFETIAMRLFDDGVITVGDFVTMNVTDVAHYLWGNAGTVENFADRACERLAKLDLYLSGFGLFVGATVPGWPKLSHYRQMVRTAS